MKIIFLTVQDVLVIHQQQFEDFGGLHGVRSRELLESAVHMPQATFDGEFLYQDIFIMGAVYAHGIIKNHPFIDGNKRTGMISALSFLESNNIVVKFKDDGFYTTALAIAQSDMNIEEIAEQFRHKSK